MIEYEETFGVGRDVSSGVGAVTAVGFLLLAPILGRVGDIYGVKRAVLLGGSIAAASYMLTSVSQEIWQIYIWQGFLFGMGAGMGYLASAAVVSQWFEKRRGFATSLAVAGGGVGNILIPPLTQHLFDRHGWRNAALVLGFVFFGCTILSAMFAKRRLPLITGKDAILFKPEWGVWKNRSFCIVAFNLFIFEWAFIIPLYHLAASAKEKGVSRAGQASIISMIGVGNLIGRLTSGLVTDRIGLKRMVLFTQFCTAVVIAVWPALESQTSFQIASCFFGVFACAFWAQLPVLVAHAVGVRKLGGAIGMIMPAMAPGGIAAAPLAGYLFETSGSYTSTAIFTASLLVVALAAISQLSSVPYAERERETDAQAGKDEKAGDEGAGGA